ncbi:MAG TPA: HIT family protein [bacterium]|nr:MAG: hypothetical protein BWY14_00671 [Parcubacteria group bacterium ADurb.Bin192]HPN14949.1 HIT family protein [bacterium]
MKQQFSKKDLGMMIRKFKYWTLYLSPNQYYLGKLRLVLNDPKIDLCELSKPEEQELMSIIKKSKKALDLCFKPDLYNYATLGNCIRHHHWHIIPRYQTPRFIDNVKFEDKNWNKPPWPAPAKKINLKIMKQIHKIIAGSLQ